MARRDRTSARSNLLHETLGRFLVDRGASNWEQSYFYKSRNVGLVIEGAAMGQRLAQFFLDDWNSPYAAKVDLCATYEVPKIAP